MRSGRSAGAGRATADEARRRFEDLLSRVSQPARLVGGEAGAGPGFSGARDEFRLVLAFPDAYEIGISNQAMQILYHIARQCSGVSVERAYLPWVDASDGLRAEGIPLLTIETWAPVRTAHMVGITLQHELNYTNVLEMLDLAGIPLRAAARAEEDPVVVGGGPAVANPAPMSPFFDAFAVGDGEDLLPELLEVARDAVLRGLPRADRVSRLAAIKGMWVPGVSGAVERRVVSRLEGAPYPVPCLVPLKAGVHDRAWVEVMRGCTRGCRFCQAGIWYRPVRERLPDGVVASARRQVDATGYEEVALASLSTTDYSGLEDVLSCLPTSLPEARVSLPSLRVDSASVRLAKLISPKGLSVTLAPEAGSQRLRDVINKNVTDEDVLSAVEESFRAGFATIKLYFMIGLPTETDEDVAAIADLCLSLKRLGRDILAEKSGRLKLHISVNNFIPKPWTPLQWEGMASREDLRRRREILRRRLRGRGISLALHDIDKSYLEAALARGDRALADVIEDAWSRGARFDAWTEQFDRAAWWAAFASTGGSPEEHATSSLSFSDALPWDSVGGVVKREWLSAERERAYLGVSTADCRWDSCSMCGACHGDVRIDLATPAAAAAERGPDTGHGRDACCPGSAGQGPDAGPLRGATGIPLLGAPVPHGSGGLPAKTIQPDRYLLVFAVRGRARFIGHLDRCEALRRALRRSGVVLALSAGLRPRPLVSVAAPLGVGIEGARELCEFATFGPLPADIVARLRGTLPAGLEPIEVVRHRERRSIGARVSGARYRACIGGVGAGQLREAALRLLGREDPVTVTERDGSTKTIDLKKHLLRLEARDVGDGMLVEFEVGLGPDGTVRPGSLILILSEECGAHLTPRRIERIGLVLDGPR